MSTNAQFVELAGLMRSSDELAREGFSVLLKKDNFGRFVNANVVIKRFGHFIHTVQTF